MGGRMTDYEIRFVSINETRVFTVARTCKHDKETIASILEIQSPVIYDRVEIWRGYDRIYEGPRIIVARQIPE